MPSQIGAGAWEETGRGEEAKPKGLKFTEWIRRYWCLGQEARGGGIRGDSCGKGVMASWVQSFCLERWKSFGNGRW